MITYIYIYTAEQSIGERGGKWLPVVFVAQWLNPGFDTRWHHVFLSLCHVKVLWTVTAQIIFH